MKTNDFSFTYHEYPSPEHLSAEDFKLLQFAIKASGSSYAPYSNYHVGAALRLANGEIFQGSNQENASFPVGSCAERVALFAAMTAFPDVPVESIAIMARADNFTVESPVTPCGICRQAIIEYEFKFNKPIRVILSGETGPVYEIGAISNLLPLSFFESSLKKTDR